MPYCINCGFEHDPSVKFCPNCGHAIGESSSSTTGYSNPGPKEFPVTEWGSTVTCEKSTFAGILLSFFIPGAGTMYAGNVGRGIIIFIACLILPMIAYFAFIVAAASTSGSAGAGAIVTIAIALSLGTLGTWIYGIYDAYYYCNENNKLWYEYLQR